MIIDPTGEVVGDALSEYERIVYADLDVSRCVEPKQFHYSRPKMLPIQAAPGKSEKVRRVS